MQKQENFGLACQVVQTGVNVHNVGYYGGAMLTWEGPGREGPSQAHKHKKQQHCDQVGSCRPSADIEHDCLLSLL